MDGAMVFHVSNSARSKLDKSQDTEFTEFTPKQLDALTSSQILDLLRWSVTESDSMQHREPTQQPRKSILSSNESCMPVVISGPRLKLPRAAVPNVIREGRRDG